MDNSSLLKKLVSSFSNGEDKKRHQGGTLQNAIPPLDLPKIEEGIIKAVSDSIPRSATEQEVETIVKGKQTAIETFCDSRDGPLNLTLEKAQAKLEDLVTNYDLHLRDGIDNLSVKDRKARDAMVSKISKLKRQLSKARTAKSLFETKISQI